MADSIQERLRFFSEGAWEYIAVPKELALKVADRIDALEAHERDLLALCDDMRARHAEAHEEFGLPYVPDDEILVKSRDIRAIIQPANSEGKRDG